MATLTHAYRSHAERDDARIHECESCGGWVFDSDLCRSCRPDQGPVEPAIATFENYSQIGAVSMETEHEK